jgi:photosystem II stability/assembly factor-like uncharacterized protein
MKNPTSFFLTFIALIGFSFLYAQDSTWVEQSVPVENGTLADLVFIDENLGWAVGQDYDNGRPVIIHTINAGDEWLHQDAPDINAFLSKIHMRNEMQGFAMGTQYDRSIGLFTIDGGQNWRFQSLPDSMIFVDALEFSNDSTAWLGGSSNTEALIYKMVDDSTWVENFAIETEGFFGAIDFIDSEYGWAAGSDWTETFGEPILAMTQDGGDSWEVLDLPVHTGFLTDVTFVNRDTGWVVGSSENELLILETMDGGNNWEELDSIDQNWLNSGISISTREDGFSKIQNFRFSRIAKLKAKLALMATVNYDRGMAGSISLILVVLTGLLVTLKIAGFAAALVLSFFIHAYAIISDIPAGNSSSPRTEQALNPGDLVCYAFGGEQGENWTQRPVIFKKNIAYSFLNNMDIEPKDIEMVEGDSIDIFVTGTDQYGEHMQVEDPRWMIDGGGSFVLSEDQNWFYAEKAGEYLIRCKDKFTGIADSVKVVIDENTGSTDLLTHSPSFQLMIQPNPASSEVFISLDQPKRGKVQLLIYDCDGKVLYQVEKSMSLEKQIVKWPTNHVPDGIYYCQVSYGKVKLIKALSIIH